MFDLSKWHLEKSLQESAPRAGLEKRLVWMGYRKNVGAELAGLDLLLSFSKAEGLPINLIEAGWAATSRHGQYARRRSGFESHS